MRARIARPAWVLLAFALASDRAHADDLIHRFAAIDTIWAAAVSPDGSHVAIGCVRDGMRAACVQPVNAVTDPTSLIGERIQVAGRDEASIAAASPLRNAAAIAAPVLLLHGTDDTTVTVGQSRTLKRQLEAAGKTVRLVEIPGDDHNLNTTAARLALLREIDTFLGANLGPPVQSSGP